MKKSKDIISFVNLIIISVFATAAVKLEMDWILNYFHDNNERYKNYLIANGNYSWYELMPRTIGKDFRGFQIQLIITVALVVFAGIVAFHFNKESKRFKKAIIIILSLLPIAFSLAYPLFAPAPFEYTIDFMMLL